jgi:hypothetical protein
MGAFKNIHTEILDYKASGRSIEDTYIYFKDYIELEDLIAVWESN